MSKRRIAVITGWALIIMAIIAGFSIGFAFPEFNHPIQIDSLKNNIISKQGLYWSMLIGILAILILDLLVSYTLYKYFVDDNKKISLISSILRIAYTLIFGIAAFYLMKNLDTNGITEEMISINFQTFQLIWSIGLVIFGFHVFLLGILMKLHKVIPPILWYITLIAGVSYVVVHILKLTITSSGFVNNLEIILALPMAIGELGLAIWLLIKGGREKLL